MKNLSEIVWKMVLLIIILSLMNGCATQQPVRLNIALPNQNDARKQFMQSISKGWLYLATTNIADQIGINSREFIGVKSSGDATIFLYGSSSNYMSAAPYGFLLIDVASGAVIKTRKMINSTLNKEYYYLDLYNIRLCAGATNTEPSIAGGSYNIGDFARDVTRCGSMVDRDNQGWGGSVLIKDLSDAENVVGVLLSLWPKINYEAN
jgi:hypothetical protein